jgi:UDP-glucose 4-epimerase
MGREIRSSHSRTNHLVLKILLTGATSLTGFWFAQELKSQGADVVCLVTGESSASYQNLKSANRFALLAEGFRFIFKAPFGSEKFINAIRNERADILCLHGSHIPDYKSESFNLSESLGNNLLNMHEVFQVLAKKNLPYVLTGTLFEAGEGDGENPTEPGSPYGLAKGLVTQAFKYYSTKFQIPMRHFVIPNPFGIYEDKKFNYYLADCWINHRTASVKTPDYVRDNIPAPLLALVYQETCKNLLAQKELISVVRPSGYVETQGAFATRMAGYMRQYLKLPCELEILKQNDFPEPRDRHNSANAWKIFPQFNESHFWKNYATYYATSFQKKL